MQEEDEAREDFDDELEDEAKTNAASVQALRSQQEKVKMSDMNNSLVSPAKKPSPSRKSRQDGSQK